MQCLFPLWFKANTLTSVNFFHRQATPTDTDLVTSKAPTIGDKPVPVKGLERTGRDFDPEPLGEDKMNAKVESILPVEENFP